MQVALDIAAALLFFTAVAHSYMGEKYVLTRLMRRGDFPRLMGSNELMGRALRVVWHLTAIAWLGFAGLLVLLAHGMATAQAIGALSAFIFLAHGAIALVASKGKHLSWIPFFAVAALVWLASRG